MNIGTIFRHCVYTGVGALLLPGSVWMTQASVNVTNFGAKGDYMTLDSLVVASNSPTITSSTASFVSGDVGKLIEVWNAGLFQTVSNQTLVAVITAVNSSTSVDVSIAPSRTASGLSGCYGTDNTAGFSNAIAAAASPTDTIIIPAGNYLLIKTNIDDYWLAAIQLRRGGLTFEGEGTAILTGQGGWRNSTITTAQGSAPKGRRGSIFYMLSPMTGLYPLTFTNLTFNGGTSGWNGGGNNGPDRTTGEGWDVSHHAVGFWQISGLTFPTNNAFYNCSFHGWRGEVMISGLPLAGGFLTVSNCQFYDFNASALNLNFAHDYSFNTFSNGNFVEEFYRSYATNASWFRNNLITDMRGLGQVGMNGGYWGNPAYTISNNRYYTADDNKEFVLTTPGTEVVISNNIVCGCVTAIALGAAGYQDEHGIWNKNIVITGNTFSNCFRVISIQGSGVNKVTEVQVSSNYFDACGYAGTGYGWSSNVVFSFNYVTNSSGIFDPAATLSGQYFIDSNNIYTPYHLSTGAQGSTNLITYGYGANVQADTYYKIITLDNSQPEKIPPGATMTIYNAGSVWSGNPSGTYPIYASKNVAETPTVILGTRQSQTFYWNKIKGGHAWMTHPIIPPLNLRTNL